MSEHYRRVAPVAEILARVEDVSAEGLGQLDQLHTGGLAASRMLAKLARISRGEVVLDAGCGVGGSARLLAGEFGAQVTAVDLSPEYVEIGRALSQKSGIPVTFECANALDLPFASGTFDVVWTQHAATNIADKPNSIANCSVYCVPAAGLPSMICSRAKRRGPCICHFPSPTAPGSPFSARLPSCANSCKNWGSRSSPGATVPPPRSSSSRTCLCRIPNPHRSDFTFCLAPSLQRWRPISDATCSKAGSMQRWAFM